MEWFFCAWTLLSEFITSFRIFILKGHLLDFMGQWNEIRQMKYHYFNILSPKRKENSISSCGRCPSLKYLLATMLNLGANVFSYKCENVYAFSFKRSILWDVFFLYHGKLQLFYFLVSVLQLCHCIRIFYCNSEAKKKGLLFVSNGLWLTLFWSVFELSNAWSKQ